MGRIGAPRPRFVIYGPFHPRSGRATVFNVLQLSFQFIFCDSRRATSEDEGGRALLLKCVTP